MTVLISLACLWLQLAVAADPPSPPAPAPAVKRPTLIAEYRDQYKLTLKQIESGGNVDLEGSPLQQYPLWPYLVGAKLRKDLVAGGSPATDARAQAFLARYGREPVAVPVRRAWLLDLAQRNEWAALAGQTSLSEADPELRCQALAARVATAADGAAAPAGLREAVIAAYLVGEDRPKSCDRPFAWLKEQGGLTAELIEQRARLALKAAQPVLARHLASQLPDERAWPIQVSGRLLEKPADEIDRLTAQPGAPVDNDALQEGFWRLARKDSEAAAQRYEPLVKARSLPPAVTAHLQRSVAVGLALDHDPRALEWFSRLPANVLDDQAHEWRVRSALLHADWGRALAWLRELPPTLAATPRWRYWLARALAETGNADAARSQFETLARERDFYGFLAAERLSLPAHVGQKSQPRNPAAQAQLLELAAVVRARELYYTGQPEEAAVEWRWGLGELNPDGKVQAALLAADWGWHEQAITLLTEAGAWDDVALRYPLQYQDLVKRASAESKLPATWIYAILRAESLYNARAASKANAFGLMQLIEPTARRVAGRTGKPAPDREALFQPEVNVLLGAHYLAEMQERHGGRFPLTAAAYNAGPERMVKWLPAAPVPADVWIENIPFNETRTYVQRVLGNVVLFGWRLNGEPERITPVLAPIGTTTPALRLSPELNKAALPAASR